MNVTDDVVNALVKQVRHCLLSPQNPKYATRDYRAGVEEALFELQVRYKAMIKIENKWKKNE